MSQTSILPTIRRLVRECGLPLADIAKKAGVNYVPFWRFYTEVTRNYNVTDAEKVHYALTGRPFSSPTVPLKKSLRKGGKAA